MAGNLEIREQVEAMRRLDPAVEPGFYYSFQREVQPLADDPINKHAIYVVGMGRAFVGDKQGSVVIYRPLDNQIVYLNEDPYYLMPIAVFKSRIPVDGEGGMKKNVPRYTKVDDPGVVDDLQDILDKNYRYK